MLTSKETIHALSETAVVKSEHAWLKMTLLAILAGTYIGFGSHLYTVATTELAAHVGFGLSKMIGGLSFSVGLILVVIAGAELFTGSVLMISGVLTRKITLARLLRNWGIVYLGNLAGSILLALLIYWSAVNGAGGKLTPTGENTLAITTAKVGLSPMVIFVRGIMANWLVCLAVYLATAAKDFIGKFIGCIFPVTAFVAMSMEHSVANMYLLTIGKLLGDSVGKPLPWAGMLTDLGWSTLGNIVGAGLFVAWFYWAIHLRGEPIKV